VADPQEFSRLLTEFQAEVTSLSKQKTTLEQENVKLTAQNMYLGGVIRSLESDIVEVKARKQKVIEGLEKQIDSVKDKHEVAVKEYDQILVDIELAKSKRMTDKEHANAESAQLNEDITGKRQTLSALNSEIAVAHGDLEDVQGEIKVAKGQLAKLDSDLIARKNANMAEVRESEMAIVAAKADHSEIMGKLDDARDELNELDTQLETKRAEAIAIDKKHEEFLEYERVSTIALETRETALLGKEENLEEQLTLVKRRNSILAK
jgi:multidrug efflux pump subunit AcrA (membrane-fusion protein)